MDYLEMNLIQKFENDKELIKKIEEFQSSELISEHPKFKVGQVIKFISGYNLDIKSTTKIIGFDKEGQIFVLWDCYWSPIRDEDPNRKIKIIK